MADAPHAEAIAITPDGVTAAPGASSDLSPVVPGATYTGVMRVLVPAGSPDLRLLVNWFDAASAYLDTSIGAFTAFTANVWTQVADTFTAPASAAYAQLWAWYGTMPTAADVVNVWDIKLVDVLETSPQTFTVIRSTNGISKSHDAGAVVRLAAPLVRAL